MDRYVPFAPDIFNSPLKFSMETKTNNKYSVPSRTVGSISED